MKTKSQNRMACNWEKSEKKKGYVLESDTLRQHFRAIFCDLCGNPDDDAHFRAADRLIRRRAKMLGVSDQMLLSSLHKAGVTICHIFELCRDAESKRLLPWLIFENYGREIETFPARSFNYQTDKFAPIGDIAICPSLYFCGHKSDFTIFFKKRNEYKVVSIKLKYYNKYIIIMEEKIDVIEIDKCDLDKYPWAISSFISSHIKSRLAPL